MGRRQLLASLDLQAYALLRGRLAAGVSIDVDHAELGVDHVDLIQRKVGEIGRQLFKESTGPKINRLGVTPPADSPQRVPQVHIRMRDSVE